MKRGILPVLILNDLAIALKNKTLFLVLFIPFFVFLSLKLIDQNGETPDLLNIALVENSVYPPGFIRSIESIPDRMGITWVPNENSGKRLLREKSIDGVISGIGDDSGELVLHVLKIESLRTLAIVEGFSDLQNVAEGVAPRWITDIQTQYEGGVQKETLPTWILMLVLLVGFIILPAQVAEEKEKKLLLALLQTPMREIQWLMAKVITGMLLIGVSVLFLHLLGGFRPVHLLDYIVFIAVGGFCFSACGIFLGFLCRTQASARTLGLIIYLPSLLPCALSDVSQKLTTIASFFPSYHFFQPLQSLLLEGSRAVTLPFAWTGLILTGLIACGLSSFLMKRRWLM
jgi:ABC-2 type transport system permease protein